MQIAEKCAIVFLASQFGCGLITEDLFTKHQACKDQAIRIERTEESGGGAMRVI
jgi:hypothetical protein